MLELTREDLAIKGILVPRGSKRFARKNQLLSSLTQLSNTPLFQMAQTHMSGKGVAELVTELLELHDDGLFKDYAAVIEQGEAARIGQSAERSNAQAAAVPSVEETMLDQEIEGLE